jgi:hypothetical protein
LKVCLFKKAVSSISISSISNKVVDVVEVEVEVAQEEEEEEEEKELADIKL